MSWKSFYLIDRNRWTDVGERPVLRKCKMLIEGAKRPFYITNIHTATPKRWRLFLVSLVLLCLRCSLYDRSAVLTRSVLHAGWSAQTQLPEASISTMSNVWWTMTPRSTSGPTFTGQQPPLTPPSNCPFCSRLSKSHVFFFCFFLSRRLLSSRRIGRTARAGKPGLAFTFLLRIQVQSLIWNEKRVEISVKNTLGHPYIYSHL